MKVVGKKHSKQYTLKQMIGSGSFGKVYYSPPYAIKQMNFQGMSPFMMNSLKNQIAILNQINHLNVVKLVDSFYQGSCVYIVMEYCQQDLCKFLKKKKCDEKTALAIFKQLVLGFRQLVKLGIIHRDLKPANILVNSKGEFKLADFGFAKYVDHYDSKLLYSIVGTPLYMSPQILNKKQYTTKSDIWSLGFILFQMITGTYPWMGVSEADLYKNITTRPLSIPNYVSAYSKDLLIRMLKINEKERISWEQLFTIVLNNSNLSPQKQRPHTSKQYRPSNQNNKQNASPTKKKVLSQTPLKQKPLKCQNQTIVIKPQKQNKESLNINISVQIIKEIFLAELERAYGEEDSRIICQTGFNALGSKHKHKFQNTLELFNQQFKKAVKIIFKGGNI